MRRTLWGVATGVVTDYVDAAMWHAVLEHFPAGPHYEDGQR